MDYIYGQLNIPHKNRQYEGKGTDFFDTKICDTFSDNKTIAVYFLLNRLIDTLEATPLKCSTYRYCSQTILVGSKVLDIKGEYPTYDYESDDGVVTIINAPNTLRGGVVIIQ